MAALATGVGRRLTLVTAPCYRALRRLLEACEPRPSNACERHWLAWVNPSRWVYLCVVGPRVRRRV